MKMTVFLFILLSFSTIAQDEGIKAYNAGDYQTAMLEFDKVIANSAKLKNKNVAKAWLYKGKTLVALFTDAATANNPTLFEKYQHAILEAANCFVECEKLDEAGKEAPELQASMTTVYPMLMQMGLGFQMQKEYEVATSYYKRAVYIGEKYNHRGLYQIYDLHGQCKLLLGDSTKAKADFIRALEVYHERQPAPDLLMGYTYFRLSIIERFDTKDIQAALDVVNDGLSFLDNEIQRAQELNGMVQPLVQQQYDEAKSDLEALSLDIYSQHPQFFEEAIERFKSSIENDPTNPALYMGYASLLEQRNPVEAIKQYEKAAELAPTLPDAPFNIGAIIYNQVVRAIQGLETMQEGELRDQLEKEAKEMMVRAYENFEKAHELDPTDLLTISTLKDLSVRLGKMDEYKHYLELEKELTQ